MTLLLITCLQELFFRLVSLDAFLQTHSSRRFKLQMKFLCSWTCSIRTFMKSTLILDPVHLNKLFSISNWWFLIPCYYQNSRGDFEKHPLFQQPRNRYRHIRKNHVWMRPVIKPFDVSLYCLHTMNCMIPQLLRCQRMIKSMLTVVCDLRQINNRRCTLSGMSRDGLNPLKLTKHPLRQISHHAGTVSESSRWFMYWSGVPKPLCGIKSIAPGSRSSWYDAQTSLLPIPRKCWYTQACNNDNNI